MKIRIWCWAEMEWGHLECPLFFMHIGLNVDFSGMPRAELKAMIESLNVGADIEGAANSNGGDKLGDKKRQTYGGEQSGAAGAAGSPKALLDSEAIGLGDLAVLSQVDESDPVTRDSVSDLFYQISHY